LDNTRSARLMLNASATDVNAWKMIAKSRVRWKLRQAWDSELVGTVA
jgi:hypothetical protein